MRDASSVAHSTPTPDIVRIPLEASLPRKLCLNVPMQTLSIKLPVHAGGPKVFWPGEGVEVGVDPYRTSVTFTAPTLTAKTMMAVEELTKDIIQSRIKYGMMNFDFPYQFKRYYPNCNSKLN